jgi:uncharacterized protein (DUF488 family)
MNDRNFKIDLLLYNSRSWLMGVFSYYYCLSGLMVFAMSQKRELFTIGHSNLSEENFIHHLKRHNITALGDVRSHPYSRYLPHFCRDYLKYLLKKNNIQYVFLGEQLGARPSDEDCYVEGKAVYEKIANTVAFKQGLERIKIGSEKHKIALMCAEKDPITCHRAILVCQYLRDFDLDIHHILLNGELESHSQLEDRLLASLDLLPKPQVQLSIFDEVNNAINTLINTPREELVTKAYKQQGNKVAYIEPENN